MGKSFNLKLRKPGRTKTCLCFLIWFFLSNLIIFGLSTFIALWSEHDSGKTFDKNFFLRQENGFRVYPILDIKSVSNSSKCPDKWQPFMKSVSTSGTSGYCICQDTNSSYSLNETLQYHESDINISSSNQVNENNNDKACKESCLKLSPSYPIMLPKINSKIFCARVLNVKYDEFVLSSDGECPKDLHLCGKDSRDFLCLDKNLPCPINKVEILPKISNQEDLAKVKTIFEDKNFEIVDFSETENIYFSNEFINQKILTQDLKASKGAPCIDPSQHVLTESESQNLKQFWKGWNVEECHKRSFSDYTTDPRYSRLFTLSKTEFFKENNFFDYLIYESTQKISKDVGIDSNADSKLNKNEITSAEFAKNYLESSTTGSLSIWHKGFTNFRNHCRQNGSSLNTFHQLHLDNVYNYQRIKKQILGANTIAWVTMIYSIILFIWVFICISRKKDAQSQKKRLIFGTILFILSTCSIIFIGITVFYIYERYKTLKWFCEQD
jgi:hypothetical protein